MSNVFNVIDSSHECAVGLAVYGLPSFLNHSCEPNTVVLFSGAELRLRSVRPIASGEQVRASLCSSLGLSVFPLSLFLPHPFLPPLTCIFPHVYLTVSSCLPLQLTISYSEVLQPREKRREHLRKVYCFDCTCPRCEAETLKV